LAVRIRMKKLGRRHRPFYRICAIERRAPRGGKILEELGTYDPMVPDTDARAILKHERVAHWLSVGAQPSEKVAILIKKYGPDGTHLEKQKEALEKLAAPKTVPPPGKPASTPKQEGEEAPAEAAAESESAEVEAAAQAPAEAATESEPSSEASESSEQAVGTEEAATAEAVEEKSE